MGETSELPELAGCVVALDLGKATLTACVPIPHLGKPGRRCQEVREYRTTTAGLLLGAIPASACAISLRVSGAGR